MKTLIATTLTAITGFLGCASTKPYENRIADLEQQLQLKDKEIKDLQGQEAQLTTKDSQRIDELTNANRELSKELTDEIQKGGVNVTQEKDKLTLSVVQEILFDSGEADIKPDGRQVLDKIARALATNTKNLIMVEGHTDDIPIGTVLQHKYPSNWELSTARATTVVRYLQDKKLNPTHLAAVGFSKFQPVASNATEEGRHKNRRIDIVLAPEMSAKNPS